MRAGAAVIAAILAGAGGAAGAATRPIELKDYYRLETASSPALSPDGRQVAFVRTYIAESENRRVSEIWLAPADGSAPAVRLTSPSPNSTGPRFSPDGKLLAFSSRRRLPGVREDADDGGAWFLRLDAPGGEAFQIDGVGGAPLFSPDNRWIAFTRKSPPPAAPKPPRTEFQRLVDERFKGRIFDWIGYRADGRGYLPDPADPAASAPEELYVVPRGGGAPRQLTRLGVDVSGVAWRPDSRALVFTADSHQRDEWLYERADVWTVTLEGETRRLTDDGHHHEAPAFSPDGQWLAVRRQLGLSAVIGSGAGRGAPVDLFLLPAGGGPLRNLTAEWDLLPGDPTFAADGRQVYFGAGVGGDAHLFRVGREGGAVEAVTQGARRLGGFSFSADGRHMAFTAADPTHPPEVFSARSDGSGERALSALNAGLLREGELRPVLGMAFQGGAGTPLEGWVMLPAMRDGQRPPLILGIHGGPHSAFQNDFSFQWQLWAASGYAVVYTNPRGSTGYGEKFLWATWGAWGDLDSEDVLAGVDAALKRYPVVDGQRLGVYGYSYGGFLTNWLIGHTPRFAAAISGAGVSNWVSDYATSDIPRTKESEFFGPPWDPRGQERLIRQSPVHYAGAVRTPTLFLHGESDFRVPIEQAEQMYLALRKRRVPARFVRYPDTSHGGWTPWNMVPRHREELRWWEVRLAPAAEPVASGNSR
jgi:dipeptidyl aminopeptidase/acylaminoacyl peptidase